MKMVLRASVLLSAVLVGGCGLFGNNGLTVAERQLLDVRHDHLRCEVKLDQLRALYQVTRWEDGGLMDDTLAAGNEMGDPSNDAPLIGGHDAPLIGGHDAPLIGGHDAPLTGGHDYADALRGATKVAADACWDSVFNLVDHYNPCVEAFLVCRNAMLANCLPTYDACLDGKHPPPPL